MCTCDDMYSIFIKKIMRLLFFRRIYSVCFFNNIVMYYLSLNIAAVYKDHIMYEISDGSTEIFRY